jgi:ribokinase
MAERIPKVLVIGPAYVDMAMKCETFPHPGRTVEGSGFSCVPTGAGVNEAIQAALCGCEVWLLARIGEDAFGGMVRQTLNRHHVCTDLVYMTQAISTGIILTLVNGHGENRSCRSAGANRVLGRDEIEYAAAEQIIGGSDVCLISDNTPAAAAVAAIRTAQLHKTRVVLEARLPSVDREALHNIDWPVDYYNAEMIILRFDNVVCGSELGSGGEGELKFIGTELVACGAKCVVISMGWHGALVIDRQGHRRIPGIMLDVVDQTGCESAFAGALAACFSCGDNPDKAVKFAVAAETLARSRFGLHDALPKKEDILMLLQEQPD